MNQVKSLIYLLSFSLLFSYCTTGANNNKAKAPAKKTTVDSLVSNLTPDEIKLYHDEIEAYYQKNLKSKGFNGSILVAKDGVILFEDYHGYVDIPHKKDSINANTPFHLASMSKTLTGTTVLKLWEQGR